VPAAPWLCGISPCPSLYPGSKTCRRYNVIRVHIHAHIKGSTPSENVIRDFILFFHKIPLSQQIRLAVCVKGPYTTAAERSVAESGTKLDTSSALSLRIGPAALPHLSTWSCLLVCTSLAFSHNAADSVNSKNGKQM